MEVAIKVDRMNLTPDLTENKADRLFQVSVFYFLIVTLTFILSPLANASDAYAVFTLNPNFNEVSKSKAKMLFRGKAKSLQGKRVELSDWPNGNEIRSEFYQLLLGKDIAQMNAYWASLSFSGKARPPKEIKQGSIAALLQWLSEKQTRIGYAPLNEVPKDANVLYIVRKEKQQ